MKVTKKGFTLIELLMVLAVIGILMGMTMAAVRLLRQRSNVALATSEVRELTKAWRGYWIAYGQYYGAGNGGWPSDFGNNEDMGGTMMSYLQGENPQGLVFMELSEDVSDEGFLDPWLTLYRMDFLDETTVEEVEYYETTVSLPNRRRYLYD